MTDSHIRLKIAESDIFECFDKLPSRLLRQKQIDQIVLSNRKFWRLTRTITNKHVIEFLLDRKKLTLAEFDFPQRKEIRYLWGAVSLYEIVMDLKPDSYFTHYTAMQFHELTEQISNVVYLNFEQAPKRPGTQELEQANIDKAFRNEPRMTKQVAMYEDKKIYLLNGKHTGKLGVIPFQLSSGGTIRITNLERTLIDSVVHPAYAGGCYEVLKAFEIAKGKVSINKLAAMLKQLNYIYPYHQAIGFYLEKAGYKKTSVDLLRKFDIKYNFYLSHGMKDTDYDPSWCLFFPKGF